ncbi:MAG: DUF2202 domain-containing protein [Saprospiraceae bacterium]|nr:DUF2202 domain-containing protein [Saprospiraceae bacterium]
MLQSEERHGSMVKDLIVKYKLQDPYSEEFGKYTSPQLQQQYNNLITKGNGSLTDAFTAGAMIEDMDVSDLDRLLAETKNPDLLEVYGYLNHGSENHLRAFNRQLERSENAYTPSYISKERFDAIILENKEGGNCTSGKTNCHSGIKKCCSNKNNKALQHRIVKKSVTKAKIHPAKKINPSKKCCK